MVEYLFSVKMVILFFQGTLFPKVTSCSSSWLGATYWYQFGHVYIFVIIFVLSWDESWLSDLFLMIIWLFRNLGTEDVHIKITHCGVCYADVVWTRNKHGDSKYPVVPGYACFFLCVWMSSWESYVLYLIWICFFFFMSVMRLQGLWQRLALMSTVSRLVTMLEWGLMSTRVGIVSIVTKNKKFFVARDQFSLLMVLILMVQ